ncbi:MAG: efflux RND transporter periplasmic adaptor subunit [Alphaproteobacteria bacterium]|nr:efflux RND transporter periplasmic adaptor subunit [Alphaproteobacteria bacterium]
MRTLGTFLFLVAFAAVMAGAAYFWFYAGGPGGGDGRGGGGPVLVTLTPAETREFVDVIEAVGTAKANESIDITAKSTETVSAVNFTDGQKVAAGDVIVEMTSREQSADLIAARAQLAEAAQGYERTKGLSEKGFASTAQLDAATSTRDSAAARVRALESRVADRLIRAPFAGVVGLRKVSVGTLVRPGDVITTLDDVTLIKLDFTVPEAFLGALRQGMTVRVTVAAYPRRTFEGKVVGIDTRVDPVSRAVAMRAEIPNGEMLLRPGMLMTVSLLKNQRIVLAVPEQSLVPVENKQYVFVVLADQTAERREVTIGARQPGYVEILSGLKRGEKVVVEGTLRLRPGAEVRVAGESEPKRERRRDGPGPRS